LTDTADEMMRAAMRLHKANQIPAAIDAYQAVVARWPKIADAWYNLGLLQRQAGDFRQALLSYERALAAGISRPEEVRLNRAVIYSDFLRDHEAATKELQQALTLNPGYTPALLNLANIYEDFGKRPEASALYARILTIDPRAYEALARFANVQPAGSLDDALIARLENALSAATSMNDRASLGFALGRALDLTDRYPRAFAAYAAGNRASRASVEGLVRAYDHAEQHALIERLISMQMPVAKAQVVGTPPRPIFIVGMFRSGSTLTEQWLAGIPGVAAGGEMDALPRLLSRELPPNFKSLSELTAEALDSLAAHYHAELVRVSSSARFVTDKRPDNFSRIGIIKSLFPDAKIVHTLRNPLDNCLSIYFLHLDQQMNYAMNLADIGHYYREYRRLMAFWKTEFGPDIYDFDYDALVRDPEAQLRGLCDFLGLEWPGQVPLVATRSAAIKTASVWQVREPLYQSSSGRHRHYSEELTALRADLADLL
jgi:tetratricopeptide (TPR) repeat protein